MLTEILIRNFAIIDELTVAFRPGFNVLTGETGAGKSIILDAVTLLLGGRADTSVVRAGTNEAYLEATFQLKDQLSSSIHQLLIDEGLDGESDELLILGREVRLSGRNICRINGRSVTLSLLKQVGQYLIDIHGQGEHLSLLQPKSHQPLLDRYAGLVQEVEELGREVKELRRVERALKKLRKDERIIAQRVDLLTFQISEIGAAQLEDGEEEELKIERTRLANVGQLLEQTAISITALEGTEDDENQSVTDLLGQVERSLIHLARLDESQNRLLQRVQGLIFELSEVSGEIQDYQESLEFDPSRLDEVETRLELISGLKRKYGSNIEEILALMGTAEEELAQISNSEERGKELEKEIGKRKKEIGRLAITLSGKRKEAAKKLGNQVEIELNELQMQGVRFEVEFLHDENEQGILLEDGVTRVGVDESGIDRLQFLLSTNPGEPLKAMAKVASGGETARLMLALKSALAKVDDTPTLIFDEIDQGIGGRIGEIVGRKLWGLAATGGHQVIVVTHLPQMAAYADIHFFVGKKAIEGRTTTSVTALDLASRVNELATMLGTKNEHAQRGSAAMLKDATEFKLGQKNS